MNGMFIELFWVLRKDVQLFLAQTMTQESKMFKVNSCSICKNPLNEACITCQNNQEANDQSQCKKGVGICNHCFHIQ
jgi:hypothetical protein